MADLYNSQRVLGVRVVDDGTVMYNNQLVLGVTIAGGSDVFVGNIRVVGVDVLGANAAIHNEQPVLGVVVIDDGRKLYNGMLVVPAYAVSGALGGALIQLSSATISDTASIGDVVGTLSVSGGSGSYTYTLTDDAGGLFAIDVAAVEVAAALTAGSYSITVEVDTGFGAPFSRAFLITVTHEDVVGPNAPVLAMDPSWDTTQASPIFTIEIDETIIGGDELRLQIQVAGGDWSSLVSDTTHTITDEEGGTGPGDPGSGEIDLSLPALSNGDYEARALVNDGTSDSNWSNVEGFTIAAAGVSSGLYMYPYLGV